ncbi:hypothetical protein RCZ04_12640 [Capnocytophaga sp. HP1101]
MKFISKLTMGMLITLNIMSCSKNDDPAPPYSGENRVYITAEGDKTLTVGETNQKIEAKISLTTKVNADTALQLKAVDAQGKVSNLVSFATNPVTITKDTREATFVITLSANASVSEEQRLKVTFENVTGLVVQEDLAIVVKPTVAVANLTPAQRALLDAYKAKGMDLYPFMGKVNVKTTVHSSADGTTDAFAAAFDRSFDGQTVITLSESANNSSPALKMTNNPMGLTEFLYFLLRKNTIEDTEFFTQQPDPQATMALINWNKDSKETFGVTLDNIKIGTPTNGVSTIDFIGDVKKDDDTTVKAVPFAMEYSAWTRLKDLATKGNAEAGRLLTVDGTSNPQHYINNDGILTDEYEVGNWKASSGSINFTKRTMTFEFLVYHTYSNGYVQVKVVYTAQ